jgi:hypothetical protein
MKKIDLEILIKIKEGYELEYDYSNYTYTRIFYNFKHIYLLILEDNIKKEVKLK